MGEHILLGGDNIDLALARTVAARLDAKGHAHRYLPTASLMGQLPGRQRKAAGNRTRAETEQPVTILGKGSGLVGGTIKAALTRDDLAAGDGRVLPHTFPSTAMPQRQTRSAVQELGLPYATDAAVTRHLAKFLRQPTSGKARTRRGPSGLACPTHILFNGGVLHARLRARRGSWKP